MRLLYALLSDARIAKGRLRECKCKKRRANTKYPWDHGTLLETLTEIEARVNDIILYMEEKNEDSEKDKNGKNRTD